MYIIIIIYNKERKKKMNANKQNKKGEKKELKR